MPYPDNHPIARWLGTHARRLPPSLNHWLCRFIRKKFHWALSPELFCICTKEWSRQLQVNLLQPVSFNDKLNFLMLYYRNPLLVKLADKYAVRDYVAQTIGENYLPGLLGVWERPEDIRLDTLPDRFVLKTNHACRTNILCPDKRSLNWPAARRKLSKWLKMDYSRVCEEWQYHDIPRKIIAEEFLDDPGHEVPRDFKFLCLGGKVHSIMVYSDRGTNTHMNVYAPDWELRPGVYTNYPNAPEQLDPRPSNLEEMLRCAEKLAAPFPQVRVDFYNLGDRRIVFGELTFSYGSGRAPITPRSFDLELGAQIDLDAPNCREFLAVCNR
ncbi:MAG: hypothetical protein IKO65_05045 [Victivallales bacterium]|nr:hypothetical protein [Victivallales bacterium]